MPDFDAYHELLGIAPSEQPPTHYRLLGVTQFEGTPTVIERAADRQMAHLRGFQVGKHAADSQRLLTEVSKARRILLSDTERAAYDAQLRKQLAASKPEAKPLKVAQVVPVSRPVDLDRSSPLAVAVAPRPGVPPRRKPLSPAVLLLTGTAGLIILAIVGWVLLDLLETPPARPIAKNPKSPELNRALPAKSPANPAPEPATAKPAENLAASPEPMATPTAEATPLAASEGQPGDDAKPVEPMPTEAKSTPPLPMVDEVARLRVEIAAARLQLHELPKFKKYYDHLAANPNTLAANGSKLATMLWTEARENSTLREHAPSYLAALQEVEHLATAGLNYKLAITAIDAQAAHRPPLLTLREVIAAKTKLLVAAADGANSVKAKLPEREALLAEIRVLVSVATESNEAESLATLLSADKSLTWTSVERVAASQFYLPLARTSVEIEAIDTARLVLDHLDSILASTTPGKERKDALDSVAIVRKQFNLISEAHLARLTLVSSLDDPAANQAQGLYLLFSRGQWRASLPHLAKGTEPSWVPLAAETTAAVNTAEMIALADRWAKSNSDPASASSEIARAIYQEAVADQELVGIARAAVEEKLSALGPSRISIAVSSGKSTETTAQGQVPMNPTDMPAMTSPAIAKGKPLKLDKWTAIFPHLNFNEDIERGYWFKTEDAPLRVEAFTRSRIRLPVVLANCSYDMVVEFDLGKDHDHVYLIIPVGDRNVLLVVDGYENVATSYFDLIAGVRAKQHPAALKEQLLQGNEHHRYKINVRLKGDRAQLTFSLNGKKQFEHEGPIADLMLADEYDIRTKAQPALVVNETIVKYTSCDVRLVEGDGYIGRDAPLLEQIPPQILAMKPTPITSLRPLSAKYMNDYFGVSTGTRNPLIDGVDCVDYVFAHAPSKLTYAIPPKARYFTSIAYCARSSSVNFTVKVDGKELWSRKNRPLAPLCIELPRGAQVLELECAEEGDTARDHSAWCYPAFR